MAIRWGVCAAAGLVWLAAGTPARADLNSDIQAAYTRVARLQCMQPDRSYTVIVHSKQEHGVKERFLRRRTGGEVLKSGLSCGCGDYALAFATLMAERGYQVTLVDGAEVTLSGLVNHSAGHVVVAVRRAGGPWCLANPTDQTILEREWRPDSRFFTAYGRCYWIGYRGAVAGYRVHNWPQLRRFYAATLARVPRSFLNAHILKLDFEVDPSLRNGANYLNPRLPALLALQPRLLAKLGIRPTHAVKIRLQKGADNEGTDIEAATGGAWVSHVGLQSGCTESLLYYYEDRVLQRSPH